MLAHDRHRRPPAVVADLYRPPIRAGSVGGVLAPFVLNHVDAPVDALVGLAACVEPGGVVLASTFSEDDRPPVKDLIDAVALRHGVEVPEAYRFVREAASPLVGHPAAMADVAVAAGLVDVEVVTATVDTGVSSPEELVAYRFALPHLVRFLAGLSPRRAPRWCPRRSTRWAGTTTARRWLPRWCSSPPVSPDRGQAETTSRRRSTKSAAPSSRWSRRMARPPITSAPRSVSIVGELVEGVARIEGEGAEHRARLPLRSGQLHGTSCAWPGFWPTRKSPSVQLPATTRSASATAAGS